MTINPIEHNLDICSTDTQCTFHDDTETTTRFSTTTAGDKLATSQSRVEASWQPDPITITRAKRPPASINAPPNKHQKSLRRDRVHADPSAKTVEDFNRDVQKLHLSVIPRRPDIALSGGHIKAVQDSYRAAIRDGRLKYDREPQLASDGPVWDPYILPAASVCRAVLNKDKVEKITQRVESTIRIVPKAVEWTAKTQEYSLTPEDVKEILQNAFVHQKSSPKPQPEQNDKLPPILEVAAKALRRAKELERGTSRREVAVLRGVAILRMVAYASMEVSIVAKEATAEQVGIWFKSLAGGKDWLRRARCFARFWCWMMANSRPWEGRELQLYFMLVDGNRESTFRKLFEALFPASAGEFVSSLSSEVYWKDLPALTRLPGLIEIEMVLLDGLVEHEIIGSALGCPVSYLEGLNPNLFSEVCTQAMTLYKPKLAWQEATCETGQEDQTKKDDGLDIGVNTDPCMPSDYDLGKDFQDLFCTNFYPLN
ncbi:uncharacterized protein PAC_01988 [Phialocephala subalpina]|uniref:Uncharacterized protein n=1 Tax=Phialocephala subalpina TaxID=576137 RepID=A0A1L7WH54_9HELO|nr:uncharacterized protein PAC_01988 [Phialocephala subalpina]